MKLHSRLKHRIEQRLLEIRKERISETKRIERLSAILARKAISAKGRLSVPMNEGVAGPARLTGYAGTVEEIAGLSVVMRAVGSEARTKAIGPPPRTDDLREAKSS